jgi:hypothetical protein
MVKKEWTENVHQKRYIWLFNYIKTKYKDAKEEDYIDKYKRYLLSAIQKNDKWGEGSKQNLYFMITRWLDINRPGDKYIEVFREAGFGLKKKSDEKEQENGIDGKEIDNLKDHEYFVEILNSIKTEDQTMTQHYKYLLYLLVHQPPVRTAFYNTASFIFSQKADDGENNFVWITKRGKTKAFLIVNQDKVSNYAANKREDPYLTEIPIENEILVKLIEKSYKDYPRTYLFELNGNAVSQMTIIRWLRDITKLSGVNVDMMRSSYINWYHNKNKSLGSKMKLAKMMRHSVHVAQKNYLKVSNDDNKTPNEEVEGLKIENAKLQYEINDLKTRLNDIKGSESTDDKTEKKRRRDVLYVLNKKGIRAKQSTMDKYNITYDEEKKLFL